MIDVRKMSNSILQIQCLEKRIFILFSFKRTVESLEDNITKIEDKNTE